MRAIAALLFGSLLVAQATGAEIIVYTTLETLGRTPFEGSGTTQVGELHRDFEALAFDPDGQLWGSTQAQLFRLDSQSGLPEAVGSLGLPIFSSPVSGDLAFAPDGTLYLSRWVPDLSDETDLYTVNTATGKATWVGALDQPLTGIAFRGEQLLALGLDEQLMELDQRTLTLLPLGPVIPPFPGFDYSHLAATPSGRVFSILTYTGPPIAPPPGSNVVELIFGAGAIAHGANIGSTTLAVREETCSPSETTLCFGAGHFAASVQWRDFEGNTGDGRRLPFTSRDSGLFYFFTRENWELMIKVLDGCAINDRWWVFASASTNVEFTLQVTDTRTGAQRTYDNPLGNLAGAIADTDAFAVCP